jgi:glycosyltransferase involved in cell wall biosynthesis
MRILVFNASYPPVACGVGDYTRGLATALTLDGHDVVAVTAAGSTPSADAPPPVLQLRNWDIGSFMRQWPRLVRPRPDVVVSCYPSIVNTSRSRLLYLVPALAKAALGWPRTVFIVHEFSRANRTEQRRLRLAFSAADRVVAVTEAERDAIVARHPALAQRTVVRHNAPSIPVAAHDPEADTCVRAAYAWAGRPVIAFFGFIWDGRKGFEELLEALVRTEALLVVTSALDPAVGYHRRLAAAIERLGLSDRVRWLGFVAPDEVGRLLRAVDAVVLPYRGGAESSSTSLLAALVNGAAVVTTRGPLNPPWLRDGETALLVDPRDPSALAGAINRLVSDERLATRIRAGARALSFGWDEITDAVVTR